MVLILGGQRFPIRKRSRRPEKTEGGRGGGSGEGGLGEELSIWPAVADLKTLQQAWSNHDQDADSTGWQTALDSTL